MIQTVNGLEISLARQYFDDCLFLSNNKITVFLEQKKKFKSEQTRERL